MEKSNDSKSLNKEKEIAKIKKESTVSKSKTGEKVNKTIGQRALVVVNRMYTKIKKIYNKSQKFGIFLFSVFLFIAGPYYIHYLNNRFIHFIKVNGGLRKEGGMGAGGMRPY